ncbi:MAG: hypothetical protein BroJett018_54560 [Chloroflexota bacterium]|nr:hypothetical protein [Chloroflexota bacterium]NOG66176.1 hypothetical protein [Chloroflexota bacterium]GIK67662.1 MAG: hypothetical protein BroJett018_54560 [Chloroflexota bacterium]
MSISLKLEDMETFDLIAQICGRHQVYPPNPDPEWTGGIEDFFRNLLSEYKGPLDKKSLADYLDEHMAKSFIAYGERPRWIQSGLWPFHNEKPMIFVGQIDIPKSVGKFHDDTSFYIFHPQQPFSDDECVVIVQQY